MRLFGSSGQGTLDAAGLVWVKQQACLYGMQAGPLALPFGIFAGEAYPVAPAVNVHIPTFVRVAWGEEHNA